MLVSHQHYLTLVTFDIISDLYPRDSDLPDVCLLRLFSRSAAVLPADLELHCRTVVGMTFLLNNITDGVTEHSDRTNGDETNTGWNPWSLSKTLRRNGSGHA